MSERLKIPRIPLDLEGYCAPAVAEAALLTFGIRVSQKDMAKFVSDPVWGTEPIELVNILKTYLPPGHVIHKENWRLLDIESMCRNLDVVTMFDLNDDLLRVSSTTGKVVGDVDGHYVIPESHKVINGFTYAKIIDSSKEDIVVAQEGIVLTEQENIYWMDWRLLERLWYDTNKDGTKNIHWAAAILAPSATPAMRRIFNGYV